MEFSHTSVLFDECMDRLDIKPGGIYVDGTLGGGGHSFGILERSAPNGILYGIDRDDEALTAAGKRLAGFGDRAIPVHGNFADMDRLIPVEAIGNVDGVLLDLGVSSHQIDDPDRGFSYINDSPLDMRMDKTAELSAYNVVNGYTADELRGIITRFGEEKWSARIAEFIVEARRKKPIKTTGELEEIILAAVPAGARKNVAHPARRTFQAIRIEVNGELEAEEKGVRAAMRILKSGGRLLVITFHSLEDHLVKELFREFEDPCICPKGAPICTCGRKPTGKMLQRKPIVASDEELKMNPRSHSAHLRVITKL